MQLAVDLPPPTDDKRVVLQEETALEWLQRLGCDMALLHTGHAELDRLKLFKNGALTEIVGEDATGKMQLGMTVIAELLLSYRKQNVAVYVIDFNGSFRMNRLAQILSTHSADPSVSCAHLLDRINYSRTRDCVQLEQRLLELESLLKHSDSIPLIFINKIGSILFEAVSADNKDGHIQKRILGTLKGFCQTFGATVITTNHTVVWRGYPTPSLGKAWINGISRRAVLGKDSSGFYALMDVDGKICSEKVPYMLTERGFDTFTQIVQTDNSAE